MKSIDKYVFTSRILLLLYRNLFAAIDKMFLIWQILLPVFQIYIMGYAYSALIGDQGISIGALSVSYVSFLTAGMMAFNVMQGSQIAGTIFWNDKRNGMFQQILAMPFNKIQYVIANLVTLIIIGLTSATAIILIGLPTIFQDINISLWSMSYTIFALVAGSVFFGSFTIILSTKMKSSETYNVFSNGLFIFFIFVSSVFYPAEGLPQPLSTAFYFNPLTYIADITRAGIFSQIDTFTNIEVLVLTLFAIGAFVIATGAMGIAKYSTSVTFTSKGAIRNGLQKKLGLKKKLLPVKNCRNISKKNMVYNNLIPKIEIDPETYVVKVDGKVATTEAAQKLSLSRLYNLF